MGEDTALTLGNNNPLSPRERLDLANRLYGEYHARCFWHCPPDLLITDELIPFVIKGLRTHGGRDGFVMAGRLQLKDLTATACDGDAPECR